MWVFIFVQITLFLPFRKELGKQFVQNISCLLELSL